ncbi:hypothetical protein HK105_201814 [Polyrhizophydium stewartii]|uniref:Cyclin N-terminal domain-containing protein n=1 Tax=Polyrhizophydium stewartii TaxID=2732419 RepID=A0ABR4NFV5_9FUNG
MYAHNTWLFSDRALLAAPSVAKGVEPGVESYTRLRACRYMERCGKRLALPRDMIATAKVLLHRFYMRANINECKYHDVGATLLFVCGKLGEGRNFKRIEQVVPICASEALKKEVQMDENSTIFLRWKETIMSLEEYALQLLCFDLSPELPHHHALNLIREKKGSLALQKLAFIFCDEALCTTLAVRCSAKEIAHAAVHAARMALFGKDLAEHGAAWLDGCDMDQQKLKALALEISIASDDEATKRLANIRAEQFRQNLKERAARRKRNATAHAARTTAGRSGTSPHSVGVPGTPSTGIAETSPGYSPPKLASTSPMSTVPDQRRSADAIPAATAPSVAPAGGFVAPDKYAVGGAQNLKPTPSTSARINFNTSAPSGNTAGGPIRMTLREHIQREHTHRKPYAPRPHH